MRNPKRVPSCSKVVLCCTLGLEVGQRKTETRGETDRETKIFPERNAQREREREREGERKRERMDVVRSSVLIGPAGLRSGGWRSRPALI